MRKNLVMEMKGELDGQLMALLGLLTVLLFGCGLRRADLDPSGFENDFGAAVVLQMIAETQVAYADQEPVPYCLVVGQQMKGASAAFMERFQDASVEWVSSADLDYDRVTKATVLKKTRTNPVVLQLKKIHQEDASTHEFDVAWNRGAEVVEKRYQVQGHRDSGQSLHVRELGIDPAVPES